MATDDLVARSRREGARRRAQLEGRPLPEDPSAPGSDGAVAAAEADAIGGVGTPTVAAGASGPWFDRRGFFLGWLALVAVYVLTQSALAAYAAGFAAAYAASRRRRVANAVVSIIGAYATAAVVGVVQLLAAILVAR